MKIKPIHFELKSEFEKKAILNAYEAFLKNCNFDIQIIIQSSQENLSEQILQLEKQKKKEISSHKFFMVNIFDQYIEFIQEKNKEKLSSSKTFYLMIQSHKTIENKQENGILELNEKYLKIKDAFIHCGNDVQEIKDKEEIKNIMDSFFYKKER